VIHSAASQVGKLFGAKIRTILSISTHVLVILGIHNGSINETFSGNYFTISSVKNQLAAFQMKINENVVEITTLYSYKKTTAYHRYVP